MAAPKSKLGASSQIFNRPAAAPAAAAGVPAAPAGGIVAALQNGDRGGVLELRLTQIAEHPDNPRTNLGDIDGLAASIKDLGVLSPLLVVPVAVFLTEHPEHVGTLNGAEYVLAAGHRRLAAARLAGADRVPAMVKPTSDKITTYVTFIDENMHRAGLDPIEEARGYSLLADAGLTQAQIAQRLRISQPQVSKRLSLLKLPQPVQDALTSGDLSVADALTLSSVDPAHQLGVWEVAQRDRLPLASAATRYERERESREVTQAAKERAAAEGVTLVADAHKEWGSSYYLRRLEKKSEIEAARKSGDLRATATGAGLTYYSAAGPVRPSHDEQQKIDERERKAAYKARGEAACQYVQTMPSEADATAAVLAAHLTDSIPYGDAIKLAHKWLFEKYPAVTETDAGPYGWAKSLTTKPKTAQLHVAWALTVAATELSTRYPHARWNARTVAYFDTLRTAVGYTPTAWEADRLAKITEEQQ